MLSSPQAARRMTAARRAHDRRTARRSGPRRHRQVRCRRVRLERRQGHRGGARRDRTPVSLRGLRRLDAGEEARQVRRLRQGRSSRTPPTDRPSWAPSPCARSARARSRRSTPRRRAATRRRIRASCAARRRPPAARPRRSPRGWRSASTRRTARSCATPATCRPSRPTRAATTPPTTARRSSSRRPQNIPSAAQPAKTPGTPGVTVTNPKLLAQFGGGSFSLNNARYTRHYLAGPAAAAGRHPGPGARLRGRRGRLPDPRREPDHARARTPGMVLEVWAFDRRTNQLEDTRRARHRRGVPEPGDRASTGSTAAS